MNWKYLTSASSLGMTNVRQSFGPSLFCPSHIRLDPRCLHRSASSRRHVKLLSLFGLIFVPPLLVLDTRETIGDYEWIVITSRPPF